MLSRKKKIKIKLQTKFYRRSCNNGKRSTMKANKQNFDN